MVWAVRRWFFCESTYHVPYFFARNSQQKHPSITDRPSKPCPMASKSSDDGRHSHPTPSSMPSLASVALEAVNFAVGVTKQPPRQHDNGAMGGSSSFSTRCAREGEEWKNPTRTHSNRFNGRSRGRGSTGGHNNQLGWGRWRGETQQLFRFQARGQFEAINSLSCPQIQQ
jgi:hypothetical protein